MATCLDCKYFSDKYRDDNGNKVDCCCRLYKATGDIIPINRNAPCVNKIQRDYSVGIDLANGSDFTSEGNAKTANKTEGESVGTVKEKIYVEINAFIADLKSEERYERKYDPLYVAIVNETEKNLRAWAAAKETPDVAEVVRCKNCDHVKKGIFEGRKKYFLCQLTGALCEPDDYCNYGILRGTLFPAKEEPESGANE